MGNSYVKDRQPTPYGRRRAAERYIRKNGKATAGEIAEHVGVTLRHGRRILEELAEWLGLYKDGKYYVMLRA